MFGLSHFQLCLCFLCFFCAPNVTTRLNQKRLKLWKGISSTFPGESVACKVNHYAPCSMFMFSGQINKGNVIDFLGNKISGFRQNKIPAIAIRCQLETIFSHHTADIKSQRNTSFLPVCWFKKTIWCNEKGFTA